MKIIGLSGSGFRKLSAFEMKFSDKGLVPIVGDNEQGKTSVLDFICWMILGNKTLNPDVINWKNEKMEGELLLDKYKIERVYSRKSSKLKVVNRETGAQEKGEIQNFLNTFINELTINPKPFLDENNLGKFKFLMKMLGIDFTEIEKRLTILEDRRLETGRKVKTYGDLDSDVPEQVEKVDLRELLQSKEIIESKNLGFRKMYEDTRRKELQDIEAYNKEQRKKADQLSESKRVLELLEKDKKETLDEITRLENELKQAKLLLKNQNASITDQIKFIEKLPQPEEEKELETITPEPDYEETTKIDEQIRTAYAINEKAEIYGKWLEKKSDKKALEEEYDMYDSEIKEKREEKLRILREADTGVKGLEIREDGVYYKNIHSDNWSDSQGLRIASELALSRIDREKQIEAIFMDRFESYGKKARKEYEDWCNEQGILALVTIVRDEKPTDLKDYFWIEAGEVEFHEEEE